MSSSTTRPGTASRPKAGAARPDDPQLPLYAVAAAEASPRCAWAKLRPGAMRFTGFAHTERLQAGVKLGTGRAARQWKNDAETLGAAFAAGDAAVDPSAT